jgi:hypothetical protein
MLRNFARRRLSLLLLSTTSALFGLDISATDTWDMLLPLPRTVIQREPTDFTQNANVAVTRVGNVTLASDLLLQTSPKTGEAVATALSMSQRTMSFTFFPDASFDIQIASEARPQTNVLSLSGRVAGQELSTFSLTVTPDNYLITLDDPDTATRYRVVGDSETGVGEVTEIDLSRMPAIIDAPPLIPPAN